MHLSPRLVTEQDLNGFVGYEICKGLHEKRESGFEVHAIGCEDHVVFVRDGRWECITPGIKKRKERKERKIAGKK